MLFYSPCSRLTSSFPSYTRVWLTLDTYLHIHNQQDRIREVSVHDCVMMLMVMLMTYYCPSLSWYLVWSVPARTDASPN
jgi:hypothetical protein